MRPGDIVVSLDGKPIENGRQLQVSLYPRLIGQVVTLEILRDGQTLNLHVAMSERISYATCPLILATTLSLGWGSWP
jgi:S1-C subfamily serine protease